MNYFRSLGSFRNAACFRRSTIYFYGFSLSYRRVPTPPPVCHNGNNTRNSIAKAWFHTFSDATFHSNRFYDAWSSTISRSHGNNLQLAFFQLIYPWKQTELNLLILTPRCQKCYRRSSLSCVLEAISMSRRSCFICSTFWAANKVHEGCEEAFPTRWFKIIVKLKTLAVHKPPNPRGKVSTKNNNFMPFYHFNLAIMKRFSIKNENNLNPIRQFHARLVRAPPNCNVELLKTVCAKQISQTVKVVFIFYKLCSVQQHKSSWKAIYRKFPAPERRFIESSSIKCNYILLCTFVAHFEWLGEVSFSLDEHSKVCGGHAIKNERQQNCYYEL